jgi:type II secretory pathway component GspD/PulD (secretin)
MKLLSLLFLLLFSHSVFAAALPSYELKMDLIFNGQAIPTAKLLIKEGEKATINHQTETSNSFVDVVASKSTMKEHPGILIKFNIGVIGKDGARNILSSPQVITKDNVEARITQNENSTTSKDKSKESFSLIVVAKTVH